MTTLGKRAAKTRQQKAAMLNLCGKYCFYCTRDLDTKTATRDHMLPKSLGYTLQTNGVPACGECNVGKSNTFPCRDIILRFIDTLRRRDHHCNNLPRYLIGFMRDQQLIDALEYCFGRPNISGEIRSA